MPLNLILLRRLLVSAIRVVAVSLFFLLALSTLSALRVGTYFGTYPASVFAADVSTLDFAADDRQPAPTCVEQIANGGFEQIALGWKSVAGASLFTYATDKYVGGQQSLLLGFTVPLNITTTFGVEQLVTLPVESRSVEFSFYYDVQIEGEASPGDQVYLTFTDVATNQLSAMLLLSPTNGTWNLGRYDLTPLAGKSLRLAFLTQNDGEPGRLTMRVDDVSILACLPPELFALQPLPTSTPMPPTPEPLLLSPQALPTAPPAAPVVPQVTPGSSQVAPIVPQTVPQAVPNASQEATVVPQPQPLFPQAGSVDSLSACSCGGTLYACTDFANWSIAQACYTHCQVTAGYDIHNLDEDRNGVACELELQGVDPLEAVSSPQSTPSAITETTIISASTPVTAVGQVLLLPLAEATVSTQPPDASLATSPSLTTTIATTVTTSTATVILTQAVTSTDGVTITSPTTVAVAPPPAGESASALNPSTGASPDSAQSNSPGLNSPATSLTAIEMLSLLLFSPLGYIAMGALIVIGSLSLWVAYILGNRGRSEKAQVANTEPVGAAPVSTDVVSNG